MSISRTLGFLALQTILIAAPADAEDYTIGKIKISEPWSRVTPPAAKVAGGLMTITNTGTEPDTLVGGSALVAQRFEVHEMAIIDGTMRMRELKPGLVIKPGETVTLKPGSFHVMLMDLTEPLAQNKPVKGTLVFEKAGAIEISYKVEPFGTRVPGDGGQPMPRAGSGSGAAQGAPSDAKK